MAITYIPLAQGFVYLAAVIDWCSRKVLAWRLSITLSAAFCIEALKEALARHARPGILNTDQGAVHQCRLHQGALGGRDRHQHGRQRIGVYADGAIGSSSNVYGGR